MWVEDVADSDGYYQIFPQETSCLLRNERVPTEVPIYGATKSLIKKGSAVTYSVCCRSSLETSDLKWLEHSRDLMSFSALYNLDPIKFDFQTERGFLQSRLPIVLESGHWNPNNVHYIFVKTCYAFTMYKFRILVLFFWNISLNFQTLKTYI